MMNGTTLLSKDTQMVKNDERKSRSKGWRQQLKEFLMDLDHDKRKGKWLIWFIESSIVFFSGDSFSGNKTTMYLAATKKILGKVSWVFLAKH